MLGRHRYKSLHSFAQKNLLKIEEERYALFSTKKALNLIKSENTMKKFLTNSMLYCLAACLVFTSCNKEDEVGPKGTEPNAQLSMNTLLAASLLQQIQKDGRLAEETITGTLTAENLDTGEETDYDWYAVIDEDAFTVVSAKTIAMVPGTYDFELVLSSDDHTYAGTAAAQAIFEGNNTVDLTLKPVIGDVNIDFTVAQSANLKLNYPVEDLADLDAPAIGVSIDGGNEFIYSINKQTGLSDTWINVTLQNHTFELTLYDGNMVVGRSNPDQEDVNVGINQNVIIDILPLYAEVAFNLNLEGGPSTFNFVLPDVVAEEVGGINNLRTVWRLNSTVNGNQEVLLDFSEEDGQLVASYTFNDFRYDMVNMNMVFMDESTMDEIGYSTISGIVLSDDAQDITMHIDLRRRAAITGNIMAVVGVNVFSLGNAAVEGAEVYVDGELAGITGSGMFGTPGYVKLYLKQGDYDMTGVNPGNGMFGERTLSVSPLDVTNLDIILDQEQQGMGLLVRENEFGFNASYWNQHSEFTQIITNEFGSGISEVPNLNDLGSLLSYKAVFINADYYEPYYPLTDAEISNLREFMAQGGKVWALGDHNQPNDSWNQSLARFVAGSYTGACQSGIMTRVNIVAGLNENATSHNIGCGSVMQGGTTLYGTGEVSLWGDKALILLDFNSSANHMIDGDNSLNRIFLTEAVAWLND